MGAEANIAVRLLEAERETLRARLDALAEETKDVKAKVRQLDQALVTLTGSAPVDEGQDGVTVKDRILMILPADGVGLSPKDIADQLTSLGRSTSNTTVSSILSRLQDEQKVEKVGGGRWRALLDTAIHRPAEMQEDRVERSSAENVGGEMVRSDGYPPARSGGSIPPTSTARSSPLWPDVLPAGDDE